MTTPVYAVFWCYREKLTRDGGPRLKDVNSLKSSGALWGPNRMSNRAKYPYLTYAPIIGRGTRPVGVPSGVAKLCGLEFRLIGARMRTIGSRGLGVSTFLWGRSTDTRENGLPPTYLRPEGSRGIRYTNYDIWISVGLHSTIIPLVLTVRFGKDQKWNEKEPALCTNLREREHEIPPVRQGLYHGNRTTFHGQAPLMPLVRLLKRPMILHDAGHLGLSPMSTIPLGPQGLSANPKGAKRRVGLSGSDPKEIPMSRLEPPKTRQIPDSGCPNLPRTSMLNRTMCLTDLPNSSLKRAKLPVLNLSTCHIDY
ncbi:hypothetical protein CRG98_028526 [Punica granatum]|uniref:Uncharacterized protein n=1 Tax=Punica granatum TaxID=22663 RepID=A0A2I0J4D2_PUNGR|nr:hypothetical protein CRG98_028526 [Punica granatum]